MKKALNFALAAYLLVVGHSAYSLDVFKTGVKLSSSLGDTYCQNITHNNKSDWRMPSLSDLLELLSEGVIFETYHCSDSTVTGSNDLIFHKCLGGNGKLHEFSDNSSLEIICIRGDSTFSETPSLDNCPAASYSMSKGILTIPLVEVPNLLGDIERYDIQLKLISDDLLFEFYDTTKVD